MYTTYKNGKKVGKRFQEFVKQRSEKKAKRKIASMIKTKSFDMNYITENRTGWIRYDNGIICYYINFLNIAAENNNGGISCVKE